MTFTPKRPDPERREDGRCARHGCKKPLQKQTARHPRYAGDEILSEPFCSTECCKTYHGVKWQAARDWERGQGYMEEWDKKNRPGKKEAERERRRQKASARI